MTQALREKIEKIIDYYDEVNSAPAKKHFADAILAALQPDAGGEAMTVDSCEFAAVAGGPCYRVKCWADKNVAPGTKLYMRPQPAIRDEGEAQPCGHPVSLLLHSTETGEPLYCEACDDKSRRADAEMREGELFAANAQLRQQLAAASERLEALTTLLREGESAIRSACSMMEPYYVQCDGADEPLAIADKIRAELPTDVEPTSESIVCRICQRKFGSKKGLKQHKKDKHAALANKEPTK